MCRLTLWAAAALLVGGLPSRADSPHDLCRVVVYPIHDLVSSYEAPRLPSADFGATGHAAGTTSTRSTGYEQMLIEYLTQAIGPDELRDQDGCIDFYPIGQALVVRGTAKIHEQIGRLLDKLRRELEPQLEFKLLVVTVPEEFFERFGLDEDLGLRGKVRGTIESGADDSGCLLPWDEPLPHCQEPPGEPVLHHTRLSPSQFDTLLAALADDPRCRTIAAPTIISRNLLSARTQMQGQNQFLSGLTIRATGDEPTFVPEMTQFVTGLDVGITGRHCSDDNVIDVEFRGSYTYIDKPPTLIQVTMSFLSPVHEMGRTDRSPTTQFLQMPSVKRLHTQGALAMTDGATVMLYGGLIERQEAVKPSSSWLVRLPYFDRLIRSVVSPCHRDHLLYLLTAKVLQPEDGNTSTKADRRCPGDRQGHGRGVEMVTNAGRSGGQQVQEAAATDLPRVAGRLPDVAATSHQQPSAPARLTTALDHRRVERVAAQLVAKYHAACAAGDVDAAREYAQMALDLDPACFSKPFATEIAPTSSPMQVPIDAGKVDFRSPVVPTGHRPSEPAGPPPMLLDIRRSEERTSDGTVDYFPFPLVPIFNASIAAELTFQNDFWRALGYPDPARCRQNDRAGRQP